MESLFSEEGGGSWGGDSPQGTKIPERLKKKRKEGRKGGRQISSDARNDFSLGGRNIRGKTQTQQRKAEKQERISHRLPFQRDNW